MGRLDGYYLMYDQMLRYQLVDEKTSKFEIKGEAAESFKRTSDTTFEFTIRKGIKFHDGTEMNAEAVKWNFTRMLTHPKAQTKPALEAVKSVDVVDQYTARFNLNMPSASLPVIISRGSGGGIYLLSKTALEKLGDDGFMNAPVGSGPMQFQQWLRDDRVTLKKFDGYWEKGADGQSLPYLEGYVERFIPDPAITQVELKSGNIDLSENIDAKDVAAIKSNPDLVYKELPFAGPVYWIAGFNMTVGNFKNLKLRQAALSAIDRDAMAKTLGFGIAKAHYYPFWQSATLGYDETLPKYEYNLEKAKQLVKEAGFPDGVEVTQSVIARQPEQRIGEIQQQMWAQAGIKGQLEALERLAFNDKLLANRFDTGFWRDSTVAVDPDFTGRRFAKGGPSNFSNYVNADLEKCFADGRSNYDEAKRAEIYKRCQRIVYEDAAIGSGYRMPEIKVYNKAVKGHTVQFIFNDLRQVWLDK
jgi:peptide/nickel transport system substrate-binding protein